MQCHPECFRIYALNYKEYIYTSGNLTHVYPYMMSPEFPDTRTIGKNVCLVVAFRCMLLFHFSYGVFVWNCPYI